MEKDHMEIILEDISGKFDLVLEGHDVLRREIQEARQESNEKHETTSVLLKALNSKIDAVAANLAAHREDTESHRKEYKVSEE